ncbi:MAG: hypothetical protein Q7N50_02430 [Armatimonadota bacterium]|nr:hypothetical protein [Armatimonadota bacterium]
MEALTPIYQAACNCTFAPDQIEPVCDHVLSCGDELAVTFHNILDEYTVAAGMYDRLMKLPASVAKKRSIQNNIRVVKYHALVHEARKHEEMGKWEAALTEYQEAKTHANEGNREFVESQIDKCRRAAAFTKEATAPSDSSRMWDGYVGLQIRRCIDNNCVWCAIILGISLAFLFSYEVSHFVSRAAGGVAPHLLLVGACVGSTALSIHGLMQSRRRKASPACHPVARYLATFGPLELVVASIDKNVQIGKSLSASHILTPLWLISPTAFGLKIARTIDIIWAYKKSTRHSTNLVHTHTTYGLVVQFREGQPLEVDCGQDERLAETYMSAINELCNWSIRGYSDELDRKWSKDRASMIATVDAHRLEIAPFIDQAYPDVTSAVKGSSSEPKNDRGANNASLGRFRWLAKTMRSVALILTAVCLAGYVWVSWPSDTSHATGSIPNKPQAERNETPDSATSTTPAPGDLSSFTDSSIETNSLKQSINTADTQLTTWKSEIDEMRAQMEDASSSLVVFKEEIRPIESDVENGIGIDRNYYDNLISEYNRLVQKHNQIRSQHNNLVKRYNELVAKRNDDLRRLKALSGGH